jgi:replicative DNA helicase
MSTPQLLPHSSEAEESLLGAMLLSAPATADVITMIRAEDFYKPAHTHIFDAITKLFASSQPIDAVTVSESLTRSGLLDAIGGSTTLVDLQAGTPTTSNAVQYATIVADYASQRRLAGAGHEIVALGMNTTADVDEARERAEQLLYAATHQRTTTATIHVADALSDTIDQMEALFEDPDSVSGVQTGFYELDDVLRGLQPGELYVIGARPSMGKSILGLNIAANVAIDGNVPALLFSSK